MLKLQLEHLERVLYLGLDAGLWCIQVGRSAHLQRCPCPRHGAGMGISVHLFLRVKNSSTGGQGKH